MANKLFEMWAIVKGDKGSDLPPAMASGALVPIYAMAPDEKTALKDGKAALVDSRFALQKMRIEPREIPINAWTAYLNRVWPEFLNGFPKEGELPNLLKSKRIFFGPIAAADDTRRLN